MNYFRFIDRYGCYTFDEVPFTEVDNVIFSSLSYLSFDGIVSQNRFSKKTIRQVGELFFQNYSKKKKEILAVRQAIKLFRVIMNTRRYQSLFLYHYVYDWSEDEQFSAITIEISPKLVYVSFEGTDQMISGWKEDLMMSYEFPVSSQRRAIDYVNHHFLFRRCNLILGGHSKGGNLAMVAGMYANFVVRERIVKIYNNDGPGLLPNQIQSKYYLNIQSKLVHIIPNYSIVGLLLCHDSNFVVVRSFRKGIMAHDLASWVVQDQHFELVNLSLFSERFETRADEWLKKYHPEQRKKVVLSLFQVFEHAHIKSFLDIHENRRLIFQILSESKEIDMETKKIIREFIGLIFRCFKDVGKEELLMFSKYKNT